MCFGTETKCTICGAKIEQKGKGRPSDYCSDSCRDFNKYKNAMESALLKIEFQRGYNNSAKSSLFQIANLIKIKKEN